MIAGINGCQIHGDSYAGFNQIGFVAGFFVCTDPSKPFYFQMELQYSGKGSKKFLIRKKVTSMHSNFVCNMQKLRF